MATFCTPASRIISELQDLDRYLTGRGRDSTAAWSIADIRGKGLTALVQMSGLVQAGAADTSIETIARRYKGRLFIASGHRGQPRLAIVDDLINVLDSLRQSRRDIDDDIMCDRSMAAELRPKADQALEQADAILAAAYDTEKLALTIASAQSSVIVDTVTLSLDSALSLELEITPKARPELARLADPRPMTLGIGLRPRWRVVPAVGLALTYSPKSRFDTFGTRPARGDSADIVTPDLDDQRFGWALSLSLTPFGGLLDRNSPTPWLDLSVNPSDDVRALGVGGAVSLSSSRSGPACCGPSTYRAQRPARRPAARRRRADLRTRQTLARARSLVSERVADRHPAVRQVGSGAAYFFGRTSSWNVRFDRSTASSGVR